MKLHLHAWAAFFTAVALGCITIVHADAECKPRTRNLAPPRSAHVAPTSAQPTTTSTKTAVSLISATSTQSSMQTTSSVKADVASSAGAIPTPGVSKKSKRGLAVPWNSIGKDIDTAAQSGAFAWMYNWECYLPPGGKGLPFIAMLRTGSQADLDRMNQNLQWSNAGALMCLNEPDIADQANLSVEQAVSIWKNVCWPKKQQYKLRLGAPAISNAPQGIPWLKKFLAQVQSTHPPDFAPLHWYGVSSIDFQNHVQAVHQAAPGLPVWVTEFASQQNDVTSQKTFMRTVMAFMDSTSWVERYSWFAFSRSAAINNASRLLSSDGQWTELAKVYATG